jgi:hypothetical protein
MRCPVPGDIPWIAAARSDREMSRYIPGIPYPYSQSDARTFLEDTDRGWAEGSGAAFVVSHAVGHAEAVRDALEDMRVGDGAGAVDGAASTRDASPPVVPDARPHGAQSPSPLPGLHPGTDRTAVCPALPRTRLLPDLTADGALFRVGVADHAEIAQ